MPINYTDTDYLIWNHTDTDMLSIYTDYRYRLNKSAKPIIGLALMAGLCLGESGALEANTK